MEDSAYSPDIPRIHTSDLIAWRRCRRKAYFSSYVWKNLDGLETSPYLWFGSGIHYALEDFHGYKVWSHPVEAFNRFVKCWPEEKRPVDWEELVGLGKGMLEYYIDYWLPGREFFPTWVHDGEPQVEVNFEIPFYHPNETGEIIAIYEGSLDGLVTDSEERLWVQEYKTAASFDTSKLPLDFQATAYTWAASQIYERDFEGILYTQMHKSYPKSPLELKTGGLSKNKQQRTTYRRYKQALLDYYNNADEVPWGNYQEYLDYLKEEESPDGDKFIRRDFVYRNGEELRQFEINAGHQILEMLNSPFFYPNPTKDCSWECNFRSVCMAMNDGSDWEQMLEQYRPRKEFDWRKKLS